MSRQKIYLLSQFNNKIGFGHLKRLINVYNILKKNFNIHFLFNSSIPAWFNLPYIIIDDIYEIIKDASFLIIDFRYYNKKFIESINNKTNLVIFDSPILFKPARYETVYINITTPIKYSKLSHKQFVYEDISFYPLSTELQGKKRRKKNSVLITFGNSDPNKLTEKVLLNINDNVNKYLIRIGDFFDKKYIDILKKIVTENKNFKIVKDYYREFLSCERVITSYGLTFIEAIILGKKIALYNNSKYHTKLSNNFDGKFFYIGTNKVTPKFLLSRRIKFFILKYNNFCKINYSFVKKRFLNIFQSIKYKHKKKCPICKSDSIWIIFNNKDKIIYECKKCNIKFQDIKVKISDIYTEEYFTEKYKEQYGNTYIKDRANIVKLANQRLKIIRSINKSFNSLLDIGCAYGFFLEEAKKYFQQVKGIEINKEAAEYGRKVLRLDIDNISIMKFKSKIKYDVVTLWYVFEHIKYPDKVLSIIKAMLNKSGIVCFAVPNGRGALFRFNKKLWFKLHPDDHYFDYSLNGLKKFMRQNGFKLIKHKITGVHPERIGIKVKCNILYLIFKILKLGDTMELYFKYIDEN